MNDELAATREAIRELHVAIKDAKQAKRELEEAAQTVRQEWARVRDEIEAKIEAEVLSALNGMSDAINDRTDGFIETVDKKLMLIVDTMLGLDEKQRRRGSPSIPDLLAAQVSDAPLRAFQRKGLEELRSEWAQEDGS